MTSKDSTKTAVWQRVTDAEVRRLYQAIGYRVKSGEGLYQGEWKRMYWLLGPDGKGVKGGQRDYVDSEDLAWARFYGWANDPRRSLDAVYKIADALLGEAYVVEMYSVNSSAEVEIYSAEEGRTVVSGYFDPARTVAVCRALLAFLDWREVQGDN